MIEFGESFPLLAASIDVEGMLMLVCTFKERGRSLRYLVLNVWSNARPCHLACVLIFCFLADD